MNLRKIFRDTACFVGLHQWGSAQTERESVKSPKGYTVAEKSRKFRRCANAHCRLVRGEETKSISPFFSRTGQPERWTDIYWKYPNKTSEIG